MAGPPASISTVNARPNAAARTTACAASRRAWSARPAPSARAIDDETPPPIAPAEAICSSITSGKTRARPASEAVPSRPTKIVSPTLTAVWNATRTTPGTASRAIVGAMGAASSRSVRVACGAVTAPKIAGGASANPAEQPSAISPPASRASTAALAPGAANA